MFYLDENFCSNFKFLSVEQIGKIVKKLVLGENFEKYDDKKLSVLESELLENLQNLNTQKKESIQERNKKSWETRKRKQAEQLATASALPTVPSVSTVAPILKLPEEKEKKEKLKAVNPVFWEAIQRKKRVLTNSL